ncbi:hypothetical protein Tco_1284333 [Tanacetum coccineum]
MKNVFQDMLHELGGKLIQLMQTTMVQEQVKTQKIQAGVQVSRLEDKDVIFSIGSTLEDFIMLYCVLVRNIRLDVCIWVTILSLQAPKMKASRRRMAKFMSNPGREHWESVKWLLRYLKGTSKAIICFSRKEVFLEGFSDLDYMSRIQKCVAMSTTEDEYMAIIEVGKELSAIHLGKIIVFHGRTKHIKIRYHYIQELVSDGALSLKKILRAKNHVDMLTKVVATKKLKLCTASTCLLDN